MFYIEMATKRRLPLSQGEQLTAEAEKHQAERSATLVNRRSVVTALAACGVAGATAGCSNGPLPTQVSSVVSKPVIDVLKFALNLELEYFEASFYLGVTGQSSLLSPYLGSSPGTVSGGAPVTFAHKNVGAAAMQLATDELEHVQFLQSTISALGGAVVSIPNINLAAGGAVTNDATFLAAARRFETVGISAYAGGAQYLVSTSGGLTYAAQILDTEAQHEGLLRELCINYGVTSLAVDALDTPPPTTIPATGVGLFNTNANGLSAVRTTSQVLQILYAAPGQIGVTSGGFFPNGLNGNIKST